MQDFIDESRKSSGINKINLKEFREKMIQNGFKKPHFFVRVDQGSPKPVSKLHERLYKEKQRKDQILKQKREKLE